MTLQPGCLVELREKRRNAPIRARKRPERLAYAAGDSQGSPVWVADNDLVIGRMQHGQSCLYMGTVVTDMHGKQHSKPYGYQPPPVSFHRLLWEGRDVWVSSEDAELREVT